MEDKESTESGSVGVNPGSTEPSGGGGLVPHVMNMAVNMSMGTNLAVPPAAVGGGGDMVVKKKRGRPRKYDADGNLSQAYIAAAKAAAAAAAAASPFGSFSTPTEGFSVSYPSSSSQFSSIKRGRGKSSGSGNWRLLASLGELFSNTAGGDFTPHVVTVHTGEDVAGKILSFAQKGPRGICVLSANGAVSNVTIRQPGSAGGILTYEGRFEILALTGSFTVSDNGGVKSRTGGLSVSLAGPDGRVIGGGIAGLLMAASPIQIVVGSFMPNGFKTHKRKCHQEHQTSPLLTAAPPAVTPAEPLSQAAPGVNVYRSPASQLPAQSNGEHTRTAADAEKPKHTALDIADLNGSGLASDRHRSSPDINLSVAVE